MIQELRRTIGVEGRFLLNGFGLLKPLLEQMLTSEAIKSVPVSDSQLERAQLDLLRQHGYNGLPQWGELLLNVDFNEECLLERLRQDIRRRGFMQEHFAAKAEARFLERKNELDQVVYSLLRLENPFLARELYLQIESGESNFADLAKRYAEGPERNTNGIVGPVSLTQAHPVLVEKLRVAQPGILLEPFRISDWWLVVRLERFAPATFSDDVPEQMCQELFDAWISNETSASLSELMDDPSEPLSAKNFSDFSIS